jgi:hypothetical protein
MVSITVRGAEKLARVSAAIAQTTPELRKDLLAGLRKPVKPTIADIRQEATGTLPSRGGLAGNIARARFGVRTRTFGSTAGVRVEGRWNGHDIAGIDAGLVRKPLFGNRNSWHSQAVRPGFFTRPVEDAEPEVTRAVLAVVEEFADKIHRRAQS